MGHLNSTVTNNHHRQIKIVLWQVLLLNLLVAGAKIAVGAMTGAISMIADGFHSVTDASSNVIGLVGAALSAQPPDHDHPYGHQKFETFATLGIGLLLLLTSWNILKSVFTRWVDGSAPEVTALSFGVMVFTIALNLAVTIYEKGQGRRLNSAILLADAAHTRSDIFVSISVLGSLAAIKLGWPWLDGVIALLIVGVIAATGWQIIRQATNILADGAVVDAAQVEEIALSVEGVCSCHKIRSRGLESAPHVDLHIQVDRQMSIEQAHFLGHLVQHRLNDRLNAADVIVHVEPVEYEARPIGLPQP